MRTIRYYVAASIDGFIAREDGRYDFFVHDDELIADMIASLQRDYDTVVMGRATYDLGLREGKTNPYPWLDTYVVTNSIETSPDKAVTLLRGIDEVEALRDKTGGRIWLCGGGQLASALLARGLIDELVVKTSPVVLGKGIPLFRGLPDACGFNPVGESKRYGSGIVVNHYATR